MKRNEFTTKLQKFIDAPFVLGDKSKGWDCLNSLAEFYDSTGKTFPREFKNFNEQNYAEKWKAGEGKKELREFLLSLGESIDPNYAFDGDLFIFDGEETAFPGIYLGRGHLLMVFDKGVKVVTLKAMKSLLKIVDVRRL
jgi:hypothetical protein